MHRWGRIAAGGLGVVSVIAFARPATADQSVLVRGTDLPAGTGLAHVGCTSPFSASGSALQPYVGQGPGKAPLGERSLGFSTGPDAAGPVAYTGSLASVTTASVSVDAVSAAGGTRGVAYVGYQSPDDAGTTRVWFGRADLVAPAGGWSEVSAIGRTFSWTQYDATTGAVLQHGPDASVAAFVAEHGDGPGLYALAFGCDGVPFSVDALRFGADGDVTTYDFEGLATRLTMLRSHATLTVGDSVQVVGSLWATGDATIAHATAILERLDGGDWQTVRVVDAGARTTAIVEPPTSGSYRWRFVDRPLAEGSTSATFVIDVAATVTARVSDDASAVTGVVAPGAAGRTVELRPAGGGAAVASAATALGGGYRIPLAGVAPGDYTVVTPDNAANLRGESGPVTVRGTAPAPTPAPTSAPSPTAPAPVPSSAPAPTPSLTPSVEPTPTSAAPASPTAPPTPEPTPTPSALPVSTPPEPTPSETRPAPSPRAPESEPPTRPTLGG